MNWNNREIIIYGTGSFSERISEKLIKSGQEILFYVDSDESRIGNIFKGKKINSNKSLKKTNMEKQLIIVASSFYADIKKYLINMGFIEYKDFIDGEILDDNKQYQISFSQEGEDIILNQVIKKEKGFYIDVGAYHPFRFSNTYRLYKNGWRGINIEPTPNKIHLFNLFRPNDINLEIGVSLQDERKEFYIYNENAYNTLDFNIVKERYTRSGINYNSSKVIDFKRLDTILNELKLNGEKIDFLNIDVEGHEMEVLLSNDWVKYKPDFLAVEIFDLQDGPVLGFLEKKGYMLIAKTPRTGIFRTRDM